MGSIPVRVTNTGIIRTLSSLVTSSDFLFVSDTQTPKRDSANSDCAKVVEVKKGKVYYAGHTNNRRHQDLSKSFGENGVVIVRMSGDAT